MARGAPSQNRPGRTIAAALLACMAGLPAWALTIDFPGQATETTRSTAALASYDLPTGPWQSSGLPTRTVEGALDEAAWRIAPPGLTTLQILAPVRDQLVKDGFATLWECETAACGGFDFRFATRVLPEPAMHVDLGDFRFLAAERTTPEGAEVVTLLVSRSAETGFAQMIHVAPAASVPEAVPAPASEPAVADSEADFGTELETGGAVALDDLAFETGSSVLGAGDFPSLDALADYLRAHPDRTVILVGHTDAAGSLASNVALSKARAASVRDRLIGSYAIPAEQIGAEGVGFLAPRASNLTEDGRTRNRRVEVMLTSTK